MKIKKSSSLTANTRKSYGVAAALAALSLTTISLTANAANTDIWSAGTNTTWNTTTANWSGATFANGDTAVFSAATGNSSITIGGNITVGNIESNGANTPATMTISGAAGDTLTIGNGDGISGNIFDSVGGSSVGYAGNLTYQLSASAGSAFAVAANSGPTWNIASGKTFQVNGKANGQTADLGNNTITLTGAGTVNFSSGMTVQNGTFNVNEGTLSFTGGGGFNTTVDTSVTVNVASGAILNLAPNTGGGSAFHQVTNLAGGSTLQTGGGTDLTIDTVNLTGAASSSATFNASNAAVASITSLFGSGGATFTGLNGSTGFILTGTNASYSGNILLKSGELVVNNNDSLGTGKTTMNDKSSPTNGSTLAVTTGSSVTLTNFALGSGATQTYTFGDSTNKGNLTLGTSGTTIDAVSGYSKIFIVNNTTTLAGFLNGNNPGSTYTVSGTGTLILTASNTVQQAWVVSASSTLLANGASTGVGTVTVNVSGFLGGTGTIGGATTVNGTIFAGQTIGATAGNVLNIKSALTLNSTATFQLDLNSTTNTSDELVSTGALTLGGTLTLNDLAPGTPTSNLTIMQGTSLTGVFSNYAQGDLVDGGLYTIDYRGDSVMLIAVPEPSTFVLAGIFGFGMLLLFRRRCFNS